MSSNMDNAYVLLTVYYTISDYFLWVVVTNSLWQYASINAIFTLFVTMCLFGYI